MLLFFDLPLVPLSCRRDSPVGYLRPFKAALGVESVSAKCRES